MIRYYWHQIKLYVGVAGALVLAIVIARGLRAPQHGPPRQSRPVPSSASAQPPGSAPIASFPTSITGKAAAPMDAAAQLAQAESLLSAAASDLLKAREAAVAWKAEIESLEGEAVDGSVADGSAELGADALFARLAFVRRRERVSLEEVEAAGSKVTLLRENVDKLLQQSSPTALSTAEVAEIADLSDSAHRASEAWRRDVRQSQAVRFFLTPLLDRDDSPSASSVASRLSEADAKATLETLDAEMEAERKLAQRRREAEAQRTARRDEEERRDEALLAEAQSPEVLALLAPFLEPRNVQPVMSGQTIKFRTTAEKQPISLKALYGINALGESDDSLKRLAMLGAHRKLSGPTWSVRSQPYNWSDDDWEMLKRASQMLRDYGAALVKAKRLSE